MGKISEESIIKLYGSIENYKESLHKKLSGKHFYTNGIEDRKFGDDEEIPEGWWKGRTNCGKGTKGMIFINNGEKQTLIKKEDSVPNGWEKGMIPFTEEHKQKISESLKNYERTPEHCKKLKQSHQSDEYKNKIRQVNLEKYGVECTLQIPEVKEKIRQTNLEKYGVEYPSQCEEVKEKVKQTNLEKYGVEYPSQREEVKEKIKQTNLEKYGVESIFYSPEIREKIKNTILKRYNNWPSAMPEIREKIKSTTIEHFGVEHHLQNPQIMQKQIDTNLKSNGVMYNIQLKKEYNNNSKPNQNFANKLDSLNFSYEREFILENYVFDFKINDILIEINPYPTHNSLWGIYNNNGLDKKYHYNKTKLAEKYGYRVIHIFDWDSEDKIINLLLPKRKIYARKCQIKDISSYICKKFLNQYHLQGNCKNQKILLGLFYENELVSVMTFGKPRYNKNYEYELLRYCSKDVIIGGGEKLFKFFINQYNPNSIISYCDHAKFKGDIYLKLGFNLKSEGKISKHWYNPKTNDHITNNLLLSLGFDNIFHTNYGKGTNNEELIIQKGYVPIYDCGQDTYIYTKF